MNEVLTAAGMSTVGNQGFSTKDTPGYRCYVATKQAIKKLTRSCVDWTWNEPNNTATLTASTNTITLPATVNTNYIHHILITGGTLNKKVIHRSDYSRYLTDVLPFKTTETVTGVPSRFFVHDNVLYFDPYADINYTITIVGQSLPQEWEPENSSTTDLNITSVVEDTLHLMALWRLLSMEKSAEFKDIMFEVEGTENKNSLLRQLVHENKLNEKRALRRMKIGKLYGNLGYWC